MDRDAILRYMSDAYLAVDVEWRVQTSNPAAETLLQRRSTEIAGQPLWSVLPDSADSRLEQHLRETQTGRVSRRLEHFSPSRYTWYDILAVPCPDGMMLFLRNATDRARQLQSEAVRAAVRQIITEAPVAIAIMRGPEHRYEITNQRLRQLIGGRDIEGRTIRNAFPELDGSGIFEILDEVYRTGVPYVGKNMPIRYDREGNGQLYDGVFDITYQPLFDVDGRVSGILTVAVEVTEYVRERERLEREAADA